MDLPPIAIAASIGVTVFAVIASLYVMATRFLYEIALLDLKIESARLRTEYANGLEALRQADSNDFEVELGGEPELVGVDVPPEQDEAIREAA